MGLMQYAIESMSYMTSAMIDIDDEDASVEAAMCKVCVQQGQYTIVYVQPKSKEFCSVVMLTVLAVFLLYIITTGLWFRGYLEWCQ